jgi:hypothetical protein
MDSGTCHACVALGSSTLRDRCSKLLLVNTTRGRVCLRIHDQPFVSFVLGVAADYFLLAFCGFLLKYIFTCNY